MDFKGIIRDISSMYDMNKSVIGGTEMKNNNLIAFIGTGAMGSAFMRGLLKAKLARPREIIGSDPEPARLDALVKELGIVRAGSNGEAVEKAATIILAVKPALVDSVMAEIGPQLKGGQTLISIAAGIPISRLQSCIKDAKVALARVMPNTPALVGAGMAGVAFAPDVPKPSKQRVLQILKAVGEVVEIEEKYMDAVTGLSGSGPAYVFLFIEALADGGVAAGLPRQIAQTLAIQTVLGAASLLKETGQHPAAAKDMVASPGGTTIAGLATLEKGAFRSSLIQAVLRATERSRELSS
jgi:pyrroline-5-carboxylate reductase